MNSPANAHLTEVKVRIIFTACPTLRAQVQFIISLAAFAAAKEKLYAIALPARLLDLLLGHLFGPPLVRLRLQLKCMLVD